MTNIKETVKKKIAQERETYAHDRHCYLVPSWGMVFWLLALGIVGSIIVATGGLDARRDSNNSVPATAGPRNNVDRTGR